MLQLDFPSCLARQPLKGERRLGRFMRWTWDIKLAESVTAKLICDEPPDSRYSWNSLAIPVENDGISLRMQDATITSFQSEWGLQIHAGSQFYIFPTQPRRLLCDEHQRILEWKSLPWDVATQASAITLTARAPQAGPSEDGVSAKTGWMEFVWLQGKTDSGTKDAGLGHYEEPLWAVEGCWSSLKGFRGFWDFLALGRVYNGRPGAFGRFPSSQTAFSLYKIASALGQQDPLRKSWEVEIYRDLMAELAYMTLATLNSDGTWENGEWLKEPEIHMRYHIDGIRLLLAAHQDFPDAALLQGAEKAAAVLLRMRDELKGEGWWFLHDTLELDAQALRAHFPACRAYTAFGKKPHTTLALNTHVLALICLRHLCQVAQNPLYEETYVKGMQVLQGVLGSERGRWAHRLAEGLLKLSFENHNCFWLRRGLRRMARTYIVPELIRIQRFWPRFITPGGYLWRDMALPIWSPWYHLVNLYDLLALYQLDARPWLRHAIDRAMGFLRNSNLIAYLLESQHYILPQWLQILKAYSKIDPNFDQNLLSQECRRLKRKGYGLPPEVHSAQAKDKVAKPAPLVSILVCTHNRSACLQQALASLVRQKTAWGEFEIIVVDNASSDDTQEVVMRFSEHHTQVRYLYEPRLGVAIARNTGAKASQARYIAYFDDDLIAEEDCLHHLLAPFQELTPAPSAVMGKVELLWHKGRPAWFPESHESLLSRFDLGRDSRWMGLEDYLITMNVAFERKTFLKTGGIREDLSRRGRMLICSGDNDIFNRYMQLKLPVFYQPKALVHHLVQRSRQTPGWLLKRAFGEGASQAIARWAGAPRLQVFRHMLWDIKITVQSVFHLAREALRRGEILEAAYVLSRRLGRLSVDIQFLLGMRKPITLSE